MARFIVRRLLGMVLVLFAVSVIVFLIFNVIPNSDPAQRIAGKNATPAADREHQRRMGLRRFAARAVPDDDEEDLHRRPDLLRRPRTTSTNRSSKGSPRRFSLCIGAAVIWMFFGILFGYLSAVRAGGWLDRLLTILAVVGISMPVFWLAAILLNYLTYKVEIFPSRRLRRTDRRPARLGLPPDPALDHARGPLHRLLQPRAALEHARRDERGLRAHGAGQGAERAPGDDHATCCATR